MLWVIELPLLAHPDDEINATMIFMFIQRNCWQKSGLTGEHLSTVVILSSGSLTQHHTDSRNDRHAHDTVFYPLAEGLHDWGGGDFSTVARFS